MAYEGNVSSTAINQHKKLAGAESKGNFGVGKSPGSGGQITPTGNAGRVLSDGERSGMSDSMGKDGSRREAKA